MVEGDSDEMEREALLAAASRAMFGKPLVTNVHRALLVEAMISRALEPDWSWCAADYASWDFQHRDGTRLEVKQSAARQSWASESSRPSRCSFDIAPRSGRYEADAWVSEPGRAAHIYVFAHHPVFEPHADHRDARQWRFYVVPERRLPPYASLGLAGVAALADPVVVQRLPDAVAQVHQQLSVGSS